jgi:hypothetical protein
MIAIWCDGACAILCELLAQKLDCDHVEQETWLVGTPNHTDNVVVGTVLYIYIYIYIYM